MSSSVQTDATLLDVTRCVRLHTLLHVVACCWELLRKSLKPVKLSATCKLITLNNNTYKALIRMRSKLTDAKTPNNVATLCSAF